MFDIVKAQREREEEQGIQNQLEEWNRERYRKEGAQFAEHEINTLRQQLTAAQAENEALRERVMELEAEALYLRARDDALVDFLCNESGVDIVSIKAACGHIPSEDAWLLRKQAEAVDDIRKDLLIDLPVHAISKAVDLRLGLRVDSLREKAEKAEEGE